MDKPQPIVYTGDSIWVKFPDHMDPMGNKIPCSTITFPDYTHKVLIGDQLVDVLGSDLERGMFISINGAQAVIVDIDKSQKFHGLKISTIPIGEKSKKPVTRKKFNCNTYEDGRIEWVVSSEETLRC